MIVVVMPRLSDSMEEGTIVRWLKADGASVARGDALLEIETDKATETHESEHDGRLAIVAAEGETVPVGATIAELHDETADAPEQREEPAPPDGPQAAPQRESGTAKGEVTVTEPTRAQQQIARRVAESRATVPVLALRTTVDMEAAAELLAALAGSGEAPTYTDLVIAACGRALAGHPLANGAYRDGHYERYARVNVGLVIDTPGALITPTVFDADRKPLEQIARETRELARRARSGEITPPELAGGTFTVSDAASVGVRSADAVITPPQAAALSMGAVEARPAALGGELVIREQMDVELACDHRILFGSHAAALLTRIRTLLEHPAQLAG
jgi:pyruvate dehydrogenase E2 component (dihydrolipoamide acetyltransferase)